MNLDFLDRISANGYDCAPKGSRMKVLTALAAYHTRNGYSPTVREIAGELGLKSHSGVHIHLEALRAHGFLRGQPRHPRSWNITPKGQGLLRAA